MQQERARTEDTPEASTARETALGDLTVVEVGEGVATAFAGMWLAAFGAHVIRIEPPGGDWTRRYHPFDPDTQTAPLFEYLNRGKQNLALDLASEDGRATLRELLSGADLLLHDCAPDRRDGSGLDEATLQTLNPRLVEVSLTPFGEDGPYARFAATPIVLLALGGYQFLSGEPGRAPLMLPGFQPDYLAGLYCLIGGLAALHGQAASAGGVHVGVTSHEVMASLHQFTISQLLYQGTIRSRHGNRWENLYPITMLPCRDGQLGFAITVLDQWERLCAMIGQPELATDPRFATAPLRRANADALDAILVDWLRDRDKLDVFRLAQEEWRLPICPLYDLQELLADPQYRARGYWVRPLGEGSLSPGLPVQMSETPWRIGSRGQVRGFRGQGTGDREQSGVDEGGHTGPPLRVNPVGADLCVRPAFDAPSDTPQSSVLSPQSSVAPLRGIRVLDFTRVWAGPLCTRILADLGAEVIKIEAPNALAAHAAMPGPSLAQKLNRNKQSIVLDLRQAEGRELVRRLAVQSDILVENFSARVMPNFGLDYDHLHALNPGLLMLAMPGFGRGGPYRDYAAYGPAIEPMTGLTSLLGYPGEPPLASAIAYPDAVAGVTGAAALLVALHARERTGRGQFIDLSQVEATTSLLGEYVLAFQTTGALPPRLGNRHPFWAPQGTYPCRGDDQWLSLSVRSDDEWRRFCGAAGLDDLLGNAQYANEGGRRQRQEEIDARIAEWTQQHDKFALMARLQAAGVPAGAVLDARELLEDPQLAQLGFYVEAEASNGHRYRMPGTPFTFAGERRRTWSVATGPGEHGRQILRDLLGLDTATLSRLEAQAVLRVPAD